MFYKILHKILVELSEGSSRSFLSEPCTGTTVTLEHVVATILLKSNFPSSNLFYVLNARFKFGHYENFHKGSSYFITSKCTYAVKGNKNTNKLVIVKCTYSKEHSFSTVYPSYYTYIIKQKTTS